MHVKWLQVAKQLHAARSLDQHLSGDSCRCLVDLVPRKLAADQLNVLTNMAELVVRQLEKDHILKLQRLVSCWPCLVLTGQLEG